MVDIFQSRVLYSFKLSISYKSKVKIFSVSKDGEPQNTFLRYDLLESYLTIYSSKIRAKTKRKPWNSGKGVSILAKAIREEKEIKGIQLEKKK